MKKLTSMLLMSLVVFMGMQTNAENCGKDACDCKTTSHTFFSMRPQYQSASPERVSMFRRRMDRRDDGKMGGIQLTVFGGKTGKGRDLAQYFTPFCKDSFIVAEDSADNPDIFAQHLNIVTSRGLANTAPLFKAQVSFEAKQSVIGLGMTWRHSISQLLKPDEEHDKHYWFEISSPITRVKNKMEICEKIENDGDEPGVINNAELVDQEFFNSVKSALNQKAWCYGRFGCPESKTRLADIEIKIGREIVKEDKCFFESYAGIIIPTGNRPKGRYIFEPIVGHNKHFGIMMGNRVAFDIWEKEEEEQRLQVIFDMNGKYFFEKTEKRSLDLKYKPWSRYMEMYADKDQATLASTLGGNAATFLSTPGINILTRDVNVKPRMAKTINSAFVYNSKYFELELGYNFYCRDSECVELACKWEEKAALKASQGGGFTNKFRTINNESTTTEVALASYDDQVIKASELDLGSAAHPGTVQHIIYGSIGYNWDDMEYPVFMAYGGGYEFDGGDNSGVNRWNIWGKAGFSF